MTKQMKIEHEIYKGDILYGYTQIRTIIAVNVERVWEDIPEGENKEIYFIENYSKFFIHEYLHSLMYHIYRELFEDREEEIVAMMSGTDDLQNINVDEDFSVRHLKLHQVMSGAND